MKSRSFIKPIILWLLTSIPSTIASAVIGPELVKQGAAIPIGPNKNDIKIYFHEHKNPLNVVKIDVTEADALHNTSFTTTVPTVIIYHGWNDTLEGDMCTSITKALSTNRTVNILSVDWSSASRLPYSEAFAEVEIIGQLCANWIWTLEYNKHLVMANTSIIGYSMGAHIAGVLGYILGSKCDHIIGLDPAGPLFQYNVTSNRLRQSSAQFVQVIHTSGSLGMMEPIGHADYYPNGGSDQTGCSSDDNGTCSSARSYIYYVESLVSGQFAAKKCNSYKEYNAKACTRSTSWLGGYDIDKSATGSYYLDTNSKSPFAKSDGTRISFTVCHSCFAVLNVLTYLFYVTIIF